MKHIFAYIFLIVFSLQILPVEEIGKMLFKSQLTEDTFEFDSENDDAPGSKLKKEDDIKFHQLTIYPLVSNYTSYISTKVNVAIHATQALPIQHIPDVATPPPNC